MIFIPARLFRAGANENKKPPRREAGRLDARYCCLYRPFSGKYTLSLLLQENLVH
jgi:hypothetical protein